MNQYLHSVAEKVRFLSSPVILFVFANASIHAGVIATDGGVRSNMNAGGTENDLSEYIIGETAGFSHSFGFQTVYVGDNTAYNQLIIQNAGKAYTSGGRNLHIGSALGADYNNLIVTGQNSLLDVSGTLSVGSDGSNNSLSVANGATVKADSVTIGHGAESSNNQLMVTGVGTTLEAANLRGGTDSIMTITAGGTVKAEMVEMKGNASIDSGGVLEASGVKISDASSKVTISGVGSTIKGSLVEVSQGELIIKNGGKFKISEAQSLSVADGGKVKISGFESSLEIVNNGFGGVIMKNGESIITISNKGLLKIAGDAWNIGGIQVVSPGQGDYIQIRDGFLALKGQQEDRLLDLIEQGIIQYWDVNSSSWSSLGNMGDLTQRFTMEYFDSDEAAYAFSGYNGLGGYTILATVAVPEPATYALILTVGLASIAITLRKRAK